LNAVPEAWEADFKIGAADFSLMGMRTRNIFLSPMVLRIGD